MFVIRSDTTVTLEGDKDEFDDIYNVLMHHDRFYTLADYDAYIKSQQDVNEAYKVINNWHEHFEKRSHHS